MDKFKDFELLCEKRRSATQHNLSKNKPIWIFGAGNFGRDLAKILVNEGFNLVGFIETNAKKN